MHNESNYKASYSRSSDIAAATRPKG